MRVNQESPEVQETHLCCLPSGCPTRFPRDLMNHYICKPGWLQALPTSGRQGLVPMGYCISLIAGKDPIYVVLVGTVSRRAVEITVYHIRLPAPRFARQSMLASHQERERRCSWRFRYIDGRWQPCSCPNRSHHTSLGGHDQRLLPNPGSIGRYHHLGRGRTPAYRTILVFCSNSVSWMAVVF
jgi:hypothetical protein